MIIVNKLKVKAVLSVIYYYAGHIFTKRYRNQTIGTYLSHVEGEYL